METVTHLTKHLILAAGRIELRLPEKGLKPKSDLYESIVKKDDLMSMMSTAMVEVPRMPSFPQMSISSPVDSMKKFSTGLPSLDSLLYDPSVSSIHYEPFQPLKIKRADYAANSDVILDDGEAHEIIRRFSEAANVPLGTVFRAKVGNISISAIISPIAGTRFLILKA